MSRTSAHAVLPKQSASEPLAVDERLIAPHQRREILEGQLIYSPPAGEDHGSQHWQLPSLLGILLAEGYAGAIDMLTRTNMLSDIAPDAAVYPIARDPKTEGRQLEEIAFEIRSEQALSITTEKAKALANRGVRRIFLIDLHDNTVCEWSKRRRQWQVLAEDTVIEDRCFRGPVLVAALVDRTRADEAVIKAVLAREDHPRVQQAREKWRNEGQVTEAARGLLLIVDARGFTCSAKQKAQIEQCQSTKQLEAWIRIAVSAKSVKEILAVLVDSANV